MYKLALAGIGVQFGQLLKRVDAEQTVTPAQVVVQEPERPLLGQRDQPDGELGQLYRKRIDVNAIDTALGDQPPGNNDALFCSPGQRLTSRCLFS